VTTSRSWLRVAVAHLIYQLILHLACALALGPWIVRALRDRRQWSWLAGRLGRLPGPPQTCAPVWVHAVSVGEVKASRKLVAGLLARDVPVVLSTGTVTGLETAERLFPDIVTFPWPLDLPWVVGPVLRHIAPRAILLVELEVWPTMMRLASAADIPQAIVNGRMSQASFAGYRRLRWWLPEFERLALVLAQTEIYAERLRGLGVAAERLHVCGNLKHDLTEPVDAATCSALAEELGLDGGRPVFLAGSTHDGEDEPVLLAWLAAGGAAVCDLVLVPRHLDRVGEIGRLLRRHDTPFTLRSQLPVGRPAEHVLLVDTLGELETLFGVADVVFLGGSLVPVGGHNVLEPAAASRPILVGPHLDSCQAEAEALQAAGGLAVVADQSALGKRLAELLSDESERRAMGAAGRRCLVGLAGATETMLGLLAAKGLLDEPAAVAEG